MKSEEKNKGGFIGSDNASIDILSDEYKNLQKIITTASKSQSKEQILSNQVFSFKLAITNYLNEKKLKNIIIAGKFLQELIDIYNIKHRDFANYVGLTESNLSSIISGKRKINNNLALKLAQIFKIDADIWINIQNKNDLFMIKKENINKYEKYNIKDLVTI